VSFSLNEEDPKDMFVGFELLGGREEKNEK